MTAGAKGAAKRGIFFRLCPFCADRERLGIEGWHSGALVRLCRFGGDSTQTVSRVALARSGIRTWVAREFSR